MARFFAFPITMKDLFIVFHEAHTQTHERNCRLLFSKNRTRNKIWRPIWVVFIHQTKVAVLMQIFAICSAWKEFLQIVDLVWNFLFAIKIEQTPSLLNIFKYEYDIIYYARKAIRRPPSIHIHIIWEIEMFFVTIQLFRSWCDIWWATLSPMRYDYPLIRICIVKHWWYL